MKHVFFKLSRIKLIVFSVLVGISIFSATDMTAQTHHPADVVPQGNFVSVPIAIARLDAELGSFKVLLGTLNPHSQAYNTLSAKALYYEGIREKLAASKDLTPSAVGKAIAESTKTLGTDAFGGLTRTQQGQFKQEVIQLLQ